MSLFTLTTPIQKTLIGNVPFVVTRTNDAIIAPLADEVALYVYLANDQDFRRGEVYRGWDFLYRGWKSHSYDPFNGAGPNATLFAAPLDALQIASRKITTDFTIDVVIVAGDIGFGYGANLDITGKNILQARSAFDALRNYYLEKIGKK